MSSRMAETKEELNQPGRPDQKSSINCWRQPKELYRKSIVSSMASQTFKSITQTLEVCIHVFNLGRVVIVSCAHGFVSTFTCSLFQALKKAAENRKQIDPTTGKKKKVTISVIEAFGNSGDDAPIPVKDVEEVLRLEYRSKLLNPKWRDAMIDQGSGGAYEISQRMTAMIGWAATAEVDNFVFDQAAERYALDEEIAKKLQKSNPEAFKNVVRRLLEAAGRGMWSTDDDTLDKLRELYSDADDLIEQGSA